MDVKFLFGKRLKSIRKSRGITQEHLAELLGLNPKSIYAIESGLKFVSTNTLNKIPEVLQVSFAELFTFDNDELPVKDLYKSICCELNTLTDAESLYFIKIIRDYKKMKKNK